jgi:hypothetical protein
VDLAITRHRDGDPGTLQDRREIVAGGTTLVATHPPTGPVRQSQVVGVRRARSSGAGTETRTVIGTVILGGVLSATLFVVPVAYNRLARHTGSPQHAKLQLEAELATRAGRSIFPDGMNQADNTDPTVTKTINQEAFEWEKTA